jgi:hypothetical protein
MNRINTIKQRIFTSYIETLVLNGEYIGDLLGEPLRNWNYNSILVSLRTYTDENYYCPTKDDLKELEKDLALLNIIQK